MRTPESNLTRITTVLKAWENLRPGKSFRMTLAEYQQTVMPSLDSREDRGTGSAARRGTGEAG